MNASAGPRNAAAAGPSSVVPATASRGPVAATPTGAGPNANRSIPSGPTSSGPNPRATAPEGATDLLIRVDELARAGDLEGAEAVLRSAREEQPGRLDLALASARVLLDLDRALEARDVLRAATERHRHPRLWFASAAAELRSGDPAAAAKRLEELHRDFAADTWVVEHTASIDALAHRVRGELAGERTFSARELLELAASANDPVVRLRALRTLVKAEASGWRDAIAIAQRDTEPALRLEALGAGFATAARPKDWVRAGLVDAAPMVRGAAAALARRLPSRTAVPLLLEFLESEETGYVFRQLHEALREFAAGGPHLATDREQDPATRARLSAAWRKHWDR